MTIRVRLRDRHCDGCLRRKDRPGHICNCNKTGRLELTDSSDGAKFRQSMGNARATVNNALSWLTGRVEAPLAWLQEHCPEAVEQVNVVARMSIWASTATVTILPVEKGFVATVYGRYRQHEYHGTEALPGIYTTEQEAREAVDMLLASNMLLDAVESRRGTGTTVPHRSQ